MADRVKLSASLLAADFTRLGEQVSEVEQAGCEEIHFDVMDGRFVPNLTFGAPVLEAVRRCTRLPIDAHMMVEDAGPLVRSFAAAGASMVTVHVEACADPGAVIDSVRAAGMKAAVSLKPTTPVSDIESLLRRVARVLVMTVEPGFGGQRFMPDMVPKVSALSALIRDRGLAVEIAVDGGITAETAPGAVRAGATVLVVGTAIFHHPRGIREGTCALREGVAGDPV